jgi:hypothetical protein
MEAGKQRWWSWAVTGSPHRCSPDRGSLASPRRRRKMVAWKEALSGASYTIGPKVTRIELICQTMHSATPAFARDQRWTLG